MPIVLALFTALGGVMVVAVVVGRETASRLPGGFALDPLGAFALRGRHDKLQVHALNGWRFRSDPAPVSPL